MVGRDHPAGGEFLQIERPSRLVFTNNTHDAAGNVILEGLTTVTVEDMGGSTKMTLRARGAPESACRSCSAAWSETLWNLGRMLAAD